MKGWRWAPALAAVALVGVAAVPAAARGSGDASAAPATIAGYNLSSLSAAVRYQLNSPGLLPVGDAREGNVIEADVPFARTTVSQGPVIDALGSPAYPGDTAAHLGTAIATFGGPSVPNDPVLAEAQYPPSPSHAASESFNRAPSTGGPVTMGAATSTSRAGENGATVESVATSFDLAVAGGPPLVHVGSARAANTLELAPGAVGSQAVASAGTITIAGIVQIAGVTSVANTRSDGTKGVPDARLQIGSVTVAGLPAYIDQNGIHVVSSPTAAKGVTAGVESMLNATLAQDGITVRTVSPRTKIDGAAASADSGGLAITIERTAPAVAVPGVASISVPGAPPIPAGTPSLPLHIELLLGAARAGANATAVPGAGVLGGELPSAPLAASAPAAPGTAADLLAPSGPGASPEAALGLPAGAPSPPAVGPLALQPAAQLPPSGSVPVGLVVLALVAALAASGPLLGYARWQLLEGRTR